MDKMNYKSIYIGDGKRFTLIAVFQPHVSCKCTDALINQLHSGGWSVLTVESETQTPPVFLNVERKEQNA